MFKLIILEDEEIALRGLADYVDWQSMGFELTGTAQTIAEAMELIQNRQVDAVLTDIRLEEETGLDLIERLREDFPHICCVILSGYDEFEYARQALRFRAFDFLTKPVNFDALRTTFSLLHEKLEKDRLGSDLKNELQELKRSAFFNNLAKEKLPVLRFSEAQELDIKVSGKMQLARIRFGYEDILEYDPSGSKAKLRIRIGESLYGFSFEIFNNVLKEYALLIYSSSQDEIIEKFSSSMDNWGQETVIGISLPFYSLKALPRAYFEAGKALDYQAVKNRQKTIAFSEIKDILYKENILQEETEEEVKQCLAQKDMPALIGIMEDSLNSFYSSKEQTNNVYSFCMEFNLIIDRHLQNYLPSYSTGHVVEFVRCLILRETIEDIKIFMKEYLVKLDIPLQQTTPDSNDVINRIQRYMQEHFTEELSLQSLSEQFYLHPIYLSKLFKEKTGENFIDCLTVMRIESAKHLLKDTNIKVYDICKMVGYESSKYFSKLFKSQVGATPTEYRETNL